MASVGGGLVGWLINRLIDFDVDVNYGDDGVADDDGDTYYLLTTYIRLGLGHDSSPFTHLNTFPLSELHFFFLNFILVQSVRNEV